MDGSYHVCGVFGARADGEEFRGAVSAGGVCGGKGRQAAAREVLEEVVRGEGGGFVREHEAGVARTWGKLVGRIWAHPAYAIHYGEGVCYYLAV